MNRLVVLAKDFILLLTELTYLPLPQAVKSDKQRLARSLGFLPLVGAVSGGALYAFIRISQVMPYSGAAAVLLGIDLLAGSAYCLRDLMAIAGGTSVQPPEVVSMDLPPDELPDNDTEISEQLRRFHVSRVGLVWGLVWLVAMYFCYYVLVRSATPDQWAVLGAPVIARLIMCWTIYYFPALRPGEWKRGLSRRGFAVAVLTAAAVVLPFSRPALFLSILVALLGVYIFCFFRVRFVGAVDQACYGASNAWAQLLFLLTWVMAINIRLFF